ncbi:MAG: cytochrome c [Paracoccaceae bacterium]
MNFRWGLVTAIGAMMLAGVSYAQLGVNKPVVQKRIYAMADIGDDMKVLGQMARGQRAFDSSAAQKAVDDIAKEAARIPRLFKAFETEAGSDARSEIWSNFGDFTAKANALQQTASGIRISSQADLPAAVGRLGADCKACHQHYRK